MFQKASCCVSNILLNEIKLAYDIGKCGGICRLEEGGVLGIEWGLHVKPVEPHLVFVGGSMPEATYSEIVSFGSRYF